METRIGEMAEQKEILTAPEIKEDPDQIAKYDPEMRFRRLTGMTARLVFAMTIVLSIFHIYTAGFGVLQEWRHRAFHLAFVLPLVFFVYTMKKDVHLKGGKHLLYDVLYAGVAAMLNTAIFREILGLSFGACAVLAVATFALVLYFKQRENLPDRLALYVDFPLYTAMVGFILYGTWMGYTHLNIRSWFEDLNAELIFWGVFLLGIFCAIIALFVLNWVRSIYTLVRDKAVDYRQDNIPYFDVFFALMACMFSVFVFLEFNNIGMRAGSPDQAELVVGSFSFLLILEGARRSIGSPLPIIAMLVLINCYLGPYFLDIPGLDIFAHRGYSISRIVDYMFLGTEGIYGIPLGVVATFVFHFVLFGLFIARTGLAQLFMDLAMALAGWSAGGPAKVAVISSGFMGSISGSSVANTVTTGSFTIPLMKKVGYRPVFAGAVEAAASTGGQIMPPIMGAAAFIMAEFLGVAYIKIATCAIVPALFYFFAVATMVHLEAKKSGLVGLSRENLPRVWDVMRERGLLIFPLFIIIYLLVSGKSPFMAAFWGIIYATATGQIHERTKPLLIPLLLSVLPCLFSINPFESTAVLVGWAGFAAIAFFYFYRTSKLLPTEIALAIAVILTGLLFFGMETSLAAFWCCMLIVLTGVFYKESKMRVPEILSSLEDGTKNAIAIGAACACVGFIVGATTLTGIGLKFATAVIAVAHQIAVFLHPLLMGLSTVNDITLFFTLINTALACFVLGMGIPTTAQYIIAAMIAAPALMQWGIHPLVSHMFVFFYAILADVTPPVALAAYAASGISGADPFRTGLRAFTLASGGFIIPLVFVSAPIVLWMPTILDGTTPFDYVWFGQVMLTMFLGVIALGATIIGYLKDHSTIPERVATGAAAAALIFPGTFTDILGIGLLAGVFTLQVLRKRKKLKTAVPETGPGA
jgi:TRAP-type uncharacterized transport system fused permease subunit